MRLRKYSHIAAVIVCLFPVASLYAEEPVVAQRPRDVAGQNESLQREGEYYDAVESYKNYQDESIHLYRNYEQNFVPYSLEPPAIRCDAPTATEGPNNSTKPHFQSGPTTGPDLDHACDLFEPNSHVRDPVQTFSTSLAAATECRIMHADRPICEFGPQIVLRDPWYDRRQYCYDPDVECWNHCHDPFAFDPGVTTPPPGKWMTYQALRDATPSWNRAEGWVNSTEFLSDRLTEFAREMSTQDFRIRDSD